MVLAFRVWCGLCLILPCSPTVRAQTVQLPGQKVFSVNTSVLAPDRGSAHLGGVRRAATGTSRRGLLRNRSWGSTTGGGTASVHVTVIDHEALDRTVLEEARLRAVPGDLSRATLPLGVCPRTSAVAAADQATALLSVAAIQLRNVERKQAQQDEAWRLVALGRQAATNGHAGAARIYWQMAHRRADKDLQKEIVARLSQLQP